jgi:hypothetical protein
MRDHYSLLCETNYSSACIFAESRLNFNKCRIMEQKNNLSSLLAPGDVGTIAKTLGISTCAASAAIKRAKPGHPAVREALRMAEASGALAAAQQLAKLTPVAQAA